MKLKTIMLNGLLKKHLVLLCLILSVGFVCTGAYLYPGGSLYDKNSVRFDWTQNFISNLFQPKAFNGAENPSRVWATIGMAFYSFGFGLFFINMAKKMSNKHASLVLTIVGVSDILFNFLIATPLHDIMVTLSSTSSLLGLFYITVFTLKTKLYFFKIGCILCMGIFYYSLFLYGFGDWGLLALMQKVTLICSMLLVLGFEYFTKKEDFKSNSAVK